MFNLDPAKLLIIAVVAVVLLGPDKLPQVARQVGAAWRTFTEFRHRMETEVRSSMPDLPSSADIARLARSPTALLDHLSKLSPDEAAGDGNGMSGSGNTVTVDGNGPGRVEGNGNTAGDGHAVGANGNNQATFDGSGTIVNGDGPTVNGNGPVVSGNGPVVSGNEPSGEAHVTSVDPVGAESLAEHATAAPPSAPGRPTPTMPNPTTPPTTPAKAPSSTAAPGDPSLN